MKKYTTPAELKNRAAKTYVVAMLIIWGVAIIVITAMLLIGNQSGAQIVSMVSL